MSERRKGRERRTEERRFVHEREEKRNGNVQERGREREANEKERETCMWKKLSGKKSEDAKSKLIVGKPKEKEIKRMEGRGVNREAESRGRETRRTPPSDRRRERTKEKGRYAEGKRGCNERKTTVA